MIDSLRLLEIKNRIEAKDAAYLLGLLEEQDKKIENLQKKNAVLSAHVLELTLEMENVKSDFGNNR